ncbi:MAG: hypothetical protein M3O26_09710 [Pseudomonadota bacterium]|nr:hypothetical protein [Pseudomonadota bacterium]
MAAGALKYGWIDYAPCKLIRVSGPGGCAAARSAINDSGKPFYIPLNERAKAETAGSQVKYQGQVGKSAGKSRRVLTKTQVRGMEQSAHDPHSMSVLGANTHYIFAQFIKLSPAKLAELV